MLTGKISNDYLKWKIFSAQPDWSKQDKAEKIKISKQAFLWVIRSYDASRFAKAKTLKAIVELCPNIRSRLSNGEILNAFRTLFFSLERQREAIPMGELELAKKYLVQESLLKILEKDVYKNLLRGSVDADKIRHESEWILSEDERKTLIRDFLFLSDQGSGEILRIERKMKLAEEVGESEEKYVEAYFQELLWGRSYDNADNLAKEKKIETSSKDAIIMAVIIKNIDALYFRDAIEIAKRFMPHDEEIVKEIERLKTLSAS